MGAETTSSVVGRLDGRQGQEVERLRRQVEVMLAYALDKGLTPAPQAWMFEAVREVPLVDLSTEGWTPLPQTDPRDRTDALVRAHRELSRLVLPARPASLKLLHGYREGRRRTTARIPRQQPRPGSGAPAAGSPRIQVRRPRVPGVGSSVPLLRWLTAATLGLLVLFVLLAATPGARLAMDLDAGGTAVFGELLLRELFLISAAGLGACLIALYRASREVGRGTYDPEFDHTFVQRIVLGMAVGLILAELVPLDGGDDGTLTALGRPAVALVGGFAASVVHRVLSRLITALEALFSGDAEEQEDARRELEQKRADEVLAQAERATLGKLLEVRRTASSGAPTRQIIEEIDRMIGQVTPG